MATATSFLLSLIFVSIIISSSFIMHSAVAFNFVIGGRDGWILNPNENYNHWSQRLRFQVNDTILFRYSNTTDSVLAVSKSDYDNCNVENAVIKLENNGNSFFKFGHSGPFYFITGNKTNCEKGQKLLVVVLAVRTSPKVPSTTGSITPVSSPPSPAPSVGGGAGDTPLDVNAPSPAPTVSSSTPTFSGVYRLTVCVVFIMMSLAVGL